MERKGLPLPERVKLRAALKLASPYSNLVHENDILQNWTSEECAPRISIRNYSPIRSGRQLVLDKIEVKH
jgi:hypothetical protein